MSAPREPGSSSLSPWWALLLLPVALFIGWFIPNLPQSKPQAHAASQQGTRALTGGGAGSRTLAMTGGSGKQGPVSDGVGSPASASAGDGAQDPGLAGGSDDMLAQSAGAESGGGVRWTSLGTATDEAKRTGKPVLLDFNADWCPPCQAMKHDVFEDPSFARTLEATMVPVSVVDRTREDGRNPPQIELLQRRFEVRVFPTLVVLSTQSGRAIKLEGYASAQNTREWIARSVESVK